MDRYGRRPPLVAAYVLSSAGFAVAGIAVLRGSLRLFVVGRAPLGLVSRAAALARLGHVCRLGN
jgi:MFS family permease